MTDPVLSGAGFRGFQDPESTGSELAALTFLFQSLLAGKATATLVKVISVVTPATLGFSGTVSVQPLVQQIDGASNAYDHGPLYNLPYFQLQGGTNAVILPPVTNDLGLAVFCDHDISSVVATGAQAPPGSRRRFDMSDGVYFGMFPLFGPAAVQYVEFLLNGGGITVVSPLAFNVTAPTINLTGSVVVTGAITATGNITGGQGGADQVGLQTHKHPTAATGAPSSPTPGT